MDAIGGSKDSSHGCKRCGKIGVLFDNERFSTSTFPVRFEHFTLGSAWQGKGKVGLVCFFPDQSVGFVQV